MHTCRSQKAIASGNLLCIPVKVWRKLWQLDKICCPFPEWVVVNIILHLFALVQYRHCSKFKLRDMRPLSSRHSWTHRGQLHQHTLHSTLNLPKVLEHYISFTSKTQIDYLQELIWKLTSQTTLQDDLCKQDILVHFKKRSPQLRLEWISGGGRGNAGAINATGHGRPATLGVILHLDLIKDGADNGCRCWLAVLG